MPGVTPGPAEPSAPERAEEPALDARGLAKSYGGVVALTDVDLSVRPGEVLALVGPNGAGKTTLLSAVAGLVWPDAGRISVLGVDARARPREARRRLGLAPQRLGLSPTLTVEQNLVFFARLAGASRATAAEGAAATARALGIDRLLRRRAGQLSGGEQRRVHVAAAVVHRPAVALLDEPTSGVDVAARQAILEMIGELGRSGAAVVCSTHHLDEVDALGASVAILDRGRLVARGDVAGLVARHARSVVELRFAADVGPVRLPDPADAEVDGSRITITTDDPGRTLARVLPALSGQLPRLESVDIVRAGLETVFLGLTGRRYPTPGPPEEGR